MAAMNFPSSPAIGDRYAWGELIYAYDGEKWTALTPETQDIVHSVNTIPPDEEGNVTLTPANVGAVAKVGDTMTGPLKLPDGASLELLADPANNAPAVLLDNSSGWARLWRETQEVGVKSDEWLGINDNSELIFHADIGGGFAEPADYKIFHEGFPPPTSGGTVTSVNDVPPDANGNVTLLTQNIPGLFDLIYPIGRFLVTSNSADPATYLGGGVWTARAGYLGGVGAISDAYGAAKTLAAGWDAGFLRVHPSHVIAHNPAWDMVTTAGGDHAHHFEVYTGVAGNHTHNTAYSIYAGTAWSGGGEGQFEWGADQVTWSGDHQHLVVGDTWGPNVGLHAHEVEGWISVGAGDAVVGDQFYPPTYGAYVWERTA